MSEPRKAPYRAVVAIKEALRQKRQLTPMEVMQAQEVLAVLRHNALLALGLPSAPDKRPAEGDSNDVARLKMRGLFEIVQYASGNPDSETDFVVALVDEAAHDFARAPGHRKGIPPQVAAANAARAARTDREVLEERLRALESGAGGALLLPPGPSDVVDDERIDAIEARLATLETALAFVTERMDSLDKDVTALETANSARIAPTEKESA